MPEVAPRITSEIVSEVPIIPNAPAALQLDKLDKVVGFDTSIAEQFNHQTDQTDYNAYREKRIDELLAKTGIIDGDNEPEHTQYLLAKEIYGQISMLTEDEWLTREDGAAAPRRNMVFRQILAEYPSTAGQSTSKDLVDDDENSDTEEDETAEEERTIEKIEQELSEAREKWAAVSAKVQGRAVNYKKIHGHNEARDTYQALVRELGIQKLSNDLQNDTDQQARDVRVLTYLFDEQKTLRELTTEKLQGTKINGFIRWMNRGGVATRIAKGVGLGLAAGGVSAAVLGVAGAGVAAAGVIGASRFIKGYIAGDRHQGMATAEDSLKDENKFLVEFEDSDETDIASRVNAAADEHEKIFKKDTKKEQHKRKRALAIGAGSVAVGAALGYGISHMDEVRSAAERLSPFDFGNNQTVGGSNFAESTLDIPEQVDIDVNEPDTGGVDSSEYSADAYMVDPGEGWYQTFADMDIPVSERVELLNVVGPELVERGIAYPMGDSYGISAPGRLPEDVLQLIQDSRR